MPKEYMSELVCGGCGHTGHVTWTGEGDENKPKDMSPFLKVNPGLPPTFTCLKCGTAQRLV